jgi:hypothetical protein
MNVTLIPIPALRRENHQLLENPVGTMGTT